MVLRSPKGESSCKGNHAVRRQIPSCGGRIGPVPSSRVMPGPALTVMAACLGDRPERAWLTGLMANESDLSLTFVERRGALIRRVCALRPHVVLLPLRDASGLPSAPLISRLRARAPNVRVLVLMPPGSSHGGLADAIHAGGEAASPAGSSELRAVLYRTGDIGLLSMREHDAARALLSGIQPAELRETLLYSVMHAHRCLTVADLATSRGASVHVLRRWARESGWPAPLEQIRWGRLLRASLLLWRESSSPSALVHASGFTSMRALRRAGARLLQKSIETPLDVSPLLVSSRLRRRVHCHAATVG